MNPWELVDQIVGVVAQEDPQGLAGRALDAALAAMNGRRGAVLWREHERVTLFTSRGIDQAALEAVHAVWARRRSLLLEGQAFAADVDTLAPMPEIRAALADARSIAVAPVMKADALVGLLLVDSGDIRFRDPRDIEALSQFARIVAMALTAPPSTVGRRTSVVSDLEGYLGRTPVEDIERQQLLILLDRNEWNIARVARVLGVTRQTVYHRLQRFGIERRHIPKILPRRQPI